MTDTAIPGKRILAAGKKVGRTLYTWRHWLLPPTAVDCGKSKAIYITVLLANSRLDYIKLWRYMTPWAECFFTSSAMSEHDCFSFVSADAILDRPIDQAYQPYVRIWKSYPTQLAVYLKAHGKCHPHSSATPTRWTDTASAAQIISKQKLVIVLHGCDIFLTEMPRFCTTSLFRWNGTSRAAEA